MSATKLSSTTGKAGAPTQPNFKVAIEGDCLHMTKEHDFDSVVLGLALGVAQVLHRFVEAERIERVEPHNQQ